MLRLFCDACMKLLWFIFVRETKDGYEVYKCPECKSEKIFRVR